MREGGSDTRRPESHGDGGAAWRGGCWGLGWPSDGKAATGNTNLWDRHPRREFKWRLSNIGMGEGEATLSDGNVASFLNSRLDYANIGRRLLKVLASCECR